MSKTAGRQAYGRIRGDDDEEGMVREDEGLNNSNQDMNYSREAKVDDDEEDDDGERITVIVMDPAQNKFEVPCNPSWTVSRFKKEGVSVHKIVEAQQRLVYMGRLLGDDTVLRDAKITKEHTIVHLFPKPRVVVCNSNENQQSSNTENEGAHVPRIVLDEHEAEMRTSILVLGSAEIMEAQNNVKLLSFLLLIISSMQLLSLFTIMLGVPQDPPPTEIGDDLIPAAKTDDGIPPYQPHSWRSSNFVDLAVYLFAFYSAVLGIRATTENTRRLAFRYLICTFVCGVAWIAFSFYVNYNIEKAMDNKRVEKATDDGVTPRNPTDLALQAFFPVFIPILIWVMCCFRAHQFHTLLQEAEDEAEQRIRNELDLQERDEERALAF